MSQKRTVDRVILKRNRRGLTEHQAKASARRAVPVGHEQVTHDRTWTPPGVGNADCGEEAGASGLPGSPGAGGALGVLSADRFEPAGSAALDGTSARAPSEVMPCPCGGTLERLSDGWSCTVCGALSGDVSAELELARAARFAVGRCDVCGAAAGELCECAALERERELNAGRCDSCGGALAVRGEETACFHCDPQTVSEWTAELPEFEEVESVAARSVPEPTPEPPPTLSGVLQQVHQSAALAARGFGVLVLVYAPDGSYRLGGTEPDKRRAIGLLFSAASSLDRRLGE